jgi:hypothetical protein
VGVQQRRQLTSGNEGSAPEYGRHGEVQIGTDLVQDGSMRSKPQLANAGGHRQQRSAMTQRQLIYTADFHLKKSRQDHVGT